MFDSRNYPWSQKMPIQSDRYIYRIIRSNEDKEYVVLCVEFPRLRFTEDWPLKPKKYELEFRFLAIDR